MKVERWDKRHRYEVDSFGVMPVEPITRLRQQLCYPPGGTGKKKAGPPNCQRRPSYLVPDSKGVAADGT